MIRRAALALLLPCAGAASAQGFLLSSPIDCDLSTTCYIQQYMDRDPGPDAQDYTCARLSNDAHKGTDFALPTLDYMARGIDVLAAASGTVTRLRDGMEDTGLTDETASQIKDRECGNGVVVRHGGGWETQYCHLKKGSIRVAEGQELNTGDAIGQVGQSGLATFPHVHMEVRQDGKTVDPFHPDDPLACSDADRNTLWDVPPPYRPGGVLSAGLTDAIPDYSDVKAGIAARKTLASDAPALVVYVFTFGTQKNDVIRLAITGPAGTVIADDVVLKDAQAQAFRAIGKKRRTSAWPAGTYTGTAALIRDGKQINQMITSLTIP